MVRELHLNKNRKKGGKKTILSNFGAAARRSHSSPLEPPFSMACSSVSILPPLPTRHPVILPMDSGFLKDPTGLWAYKVEFGFWITFSLRLFQGEILIPWSFDVLTSSQRQKKGNERLSIASKWQGSTGFWVSVILLIALNTYKVQILLLIL